MNDQLTREQFETLAEYSEPHLVSIYLSTVEAGPEIEQNSIRFKNLLSEAESELVEEGMRVPEAQTLLGPAMDLIDRRDFWQHQSSGLAVFLSGDQMTTLRLPIAFEHQVRVGKKFALRPLLPLLNANGIYYILTLDQNQVHIYEASRYQIEEMSSDELPESLSDALWHDDMEPTLQHHTTGSTSGEGGAPAVHHGHGRGEDPDKKNELLRYFRRIDQGVDELMRAKNQLNTTPKARPLVLVGVDYYLPIYHEANTYPHLMDEGVKMNPGSLTTEEIHEHSWEVVADTFKESQTEAIEQFNNQSDSLMTDKDLEQILYAAHYGRVETLFISQDASRWGTFDESSGEVTFHEERRADSQDLLEEAALKAMKNGGAVYAMPKESIPGQSSIAAIYRYEMEPQA